MAPREYVVFFGFMFSADVLLSKQLLCTNHINRSYAKHNTFFPPWSTVLYFCTTVFIDIYYTS